MPSSRGSSVARPAETPAPEARARFTAGDPNEIPVLRASVDAPGDGGATLPFHPSIAGDRHADRAFLPSSRPPPRRAGRRRQRPQDRTRRRLEALAASINTLGLIQPLVVVPGGDGYHYVVDGKPPSRRPRKPRRGRETGTAQQGPGDECDAGIAREAGSPPTSTSRRCTRPTKVEAYAELRRAGMKEKDIAARFGQPVAQVRKLLALGGVSPAVLDAWRAGKVRAEDVRTFTLAPSHADHGSRAGCCPQGRPHLVDPGEALP